jgi:hypothetical protein
LFVLVAATDISPYNRSNYFFNEEKATETYTHTEASAGNSSEDNGMQLGGACII